MITKEDIEKIKDYPLDILFGMMLYASEVITNKKCRYRYKGETKANAIEQLGIIQNEIRRRIKEGVTV